MGKYEVYGMSCAACSSRVEKAVSSLSGVEKCSVNLLTNSMTVEGTAREEEIISAVKNAGYDAEKSGVKKEEKKSNGDIKTKGIMYRLIASLILLIPLMYISMGHTMWGWSLPQFLAGNPLGIGISQMLLSALILVINQRFFISGGKAIFNKAPNMDSLVAIGSGASFIYSVCVLYVMSWSVLNGDTKTAASYLHEFYFESAAMILVLITVGKMLEARSKGKTTDALASLLKLSAKEATILKDGKSVRVKIEDLKKGDIFIVRPGESVPADGVIIKGESAIDESALTGESIPVDKSVGDKVSAATINQSGYIECEATRVGEDTAFSKIIKMVTDAASSKAPIARVADRVSGVFVPIVIGIAFVTTVIWLFFGKNIGFALARGISVLVISCPCALGLATPVAIMVGNGVGAKRGILFKNAESLEETGKAKIVVLDKTGTVTEGRPKVTDIISVKDDSELLVVAYSLEKLSEHPLAKAIVEKAEEVGILAKEVTEFKAVSGNGLEGVISGEKVCGGKSDFVEKYADLPEEYKSKARELSSDGKTPMFFAKDGEFLGIIAVSDVVKEDAQNSIKELKEMGISVVMLTGDNEETANAIGRTVGIEKVIAEVLPDGKEKVIRELKSKGKVVMVGDGINDAPSLTSADVGIAIGAGTDVAIDSADVVLVKSKLSDLVTAIRLSKKTLKNIHENLFWAFIYNIIGIPVAAGVLIPVFGISLNPMIGALAMSLSSVCVVSNALRLNRFKDKKIVKKEIKVMEKTLKVEGMMCMHCEGRVKTCLEGLDGVNEAIVSHKEGTAKVILSQDIGYDVLKKTVEDQGYKVIE